MAHFFLMEPQQSSIYHSLGRPTVRKSSTTPTEPERSDSMFSSNGSPSPTNTTNSPPTSRNNSASGATGRTCTWSHALVVERATATPSDADIMLVPVKLENRFRKSSVDGAEELPGRPAPRSFLRRLSTRISPSYDNAAAKEDRIRIVKMPRRDYNKFFVRDRSGNYLGSEEERSWDEYDLDREFGAYQDAPLGPR